MVCGQRPAGDAVTRGRALSISVDGEAVPLADAVTDPGVLIDKHATFEPHVSKLTQAMTSALCQMALMGYLFHQRSTLVSGQLYDGELAAPLSRRLGRVRKTQKKRLQRVVNFAA